MATASRGGLASPGGVPNAAPDRLSLPLTGRHADTLPSFGTPGSVSAVTTRNTGPVLTNKLTCNCCVPPKNAYTNLMPRP